MIFPIHYLLLTLLDGIHGLSLTLGGRPVYIRSMGSFLPNDPVPNSDIDKHLGSLGHSSLTRRKVLFLNRIRNRHYAVIEGKPTHLGIELAAEAVADALRKSAGVDLESIGMLATGTTMPDVLIPGFANLLHGILPTKSSMDCLSSSGVCISGLNALKAATHSIALGEHDRALVTGTECASPSLLAPRYSKAFDCKQHQGEDIIPDFDAEFLRYMLSDGSGVALLDNEPHPTNLCFRLQAFYHHSFANELPPCMTGGAPPGEYLKVGNTYSPHVGSDEPRDQWNVLRQDTHLLGQHMLSKSDKFIRIALEKKLLVSGAVRWIGFYHTFLP